MSNSILHANGHRSSWTRREFAQAIGGALLARSIVVGDQPKARRELIGEVGVTTGSFTKHLTVEPQDGKLRMLDLPRIMRDKLQMRVIDLMTATVPSLETAYLEQFRKRADQAGCVITNLKMNQRGLDMASDDPSVREKALAEYKRTIDAAAILGCRWVRPLPLDHRPDVTRLAASYRELIDYAAPKKSSLLIENFGWMQDDSEAIPSVIKAVGSGLAASPDTGNWTDKARYDGLAKAFPLAVTCDFKAFQFEPDGSHPKYDLRRCFQVAWAAGFRGPWCLEHFHTSLDGLFAGMIRLRDMLKQWTAAAGKN